MGELSFDTLDAFAYSIIGHKKENSLKVKSVDECLIVAGIGIKPYNKPVIFSDSISGIELSLNYKVEVDNSFVVIVAQSGWYDFASVTLPSGFTKVVDQTGLDTYETSCIGVNATQSKGEYTVNAVATDDDVTGISISVYVFPPDSYTYTTNYVKGSNIELEKTLTLNTDYDFYIFCAGDGNDPLTVIVECPFCGEYFTALDLLLFSDYGEDSVLCSLCGYDNSMTSKFIGISV